MSNHSPELEFLIKHVNYLSNIVNKSKDLCIEFDGFIVRLLEQPEIKNIDIPIQYKILLAEARYELVVTHGTEEYRSSAIKLFETAIKYGIKHQHDYSEYERKKKILSGE